MSSFWLQFLPRHFRERLFGRDELRKAIDNTGWLFADKLVRMGLGLVVGIWVARYLGPTQFGLLSFVGSFVAIFSSLSLLGLDGIVVRDLVKAPEHAAEILGVTFFLRLSAGAIAYLAMLGAILLFRPDDRLAQVFAAIMGAGLLFQALDTIDLWFQSKVRSVYVVYAKCSAFIVSSVAKIALVMVRAPLIDFVIVGVVELLLAATGLLVAYRYQGQRISAWRVNLAHARRLLSDCWPLLLSGVVFMVYMRIDQVMLGQMIDDHEVGVYSAAVRLAEVWYFIPTAVVSSVFPNIVRAREVDAVEFYNRLQRLYNLLAFMGYAVAVPVTFVSGVVVSRLFGQDYAAAGPMLALLIWAGLFANLAVARNAYLLAMNWSRVLFGMVLAGALVNVLLNLVLIPRYGGMGAVIASCVAYWVAAHGGGLLYAPLRKSTQMLTRALLCPKFW
ncbi:lipopolysaccharide/O-antigen transporter [Desulfuromonas sp. DDH964]|uniref:flippase n=1 Tax=Desulfuromonas sp. DDH964 TaxID=1823759 RepID=UPI00078E8EB5|nr:flippase [Desulfuromonas sp. DDH964]AMV73150.1 lipopolysaccharide/O-antigen transporter [Desulfuromonas sp. DDH964]